MHTSELDKHNFKNIYCNIVVEYVSESSNFVQNGEALRRSRSRSVRDKYSALEELPVARFGTYGEELAIGFSRELVQAGRLSFVFVVAIEFGASKLVGRFRIWI